MGIFEVQAPEILRDSDIHISGSKSISNRILMIQKLSGKAFDIQNLSDSDDTNVLKDCLESDDKSMIDVHHAGTSFRFLTAYLALLPGEQILTGSKRMQERPIGALVDALRQIGCDIEYTKNEFYPPLRIASFKGQKTRVISIQAGISSQYISALCMIAPKLESGLEIRFIGELVSKPYLEMTLSMMKDYGIKIQRTTTSISIEPQAYQSRPYLVESDWSSASYIMALCSLYPKSKLNLSHYFQDSLQGDSALVKIFQHFGLESRFEGSRLLIENKGTMLRSFSYDFIDQPDLFQTISVLCAAQNIDLKARGLKTLKIKETDRVLALKTELAKTGIQISDYEGPEWEIAQEGKIHDPNEAFETYQDHRMAMSLSLLASKFKVRISDPSVVSKSYPGFWKDLEELGFVISEK